MGKKNRSTVERILEERGLSHEWFINEAKRRFGFTKAYSRDIIRGKFALDINNKFRLAICLGVSYKDFN